MTNNDFQVVCGIALISPDIAVENEQVKDFLKKDKDKASNLTSQLILTGILRDEF